MGINVIINVSTFHFPTLRKPTLTLLTPTPTSNSNPKFWATTTSNNCYYTNTNNNSIITINKPTRNKRKTIPPVAASVNMLLSGNPVLSDVIATAISGSIALGFLRLWQFTANYGVFDSKLNRKLVHISIGLVFMLCWPLFSSGYRGALLASLVPGVNILRMLLLGLEVYKDEGTVKSMSRHGDHSVKFSALSALGCLVIELVGLDNDFYVSHDGLGDRKRHGMLTARRV